MTTNTVTPAPRAQIEDGTWTDLRVVVPELEGGLPGRTVLLDDAGEPLLTFRSTDDLFSLARLLDESARQCLALWSLSAPVEVRTSEKNGLLEAQAGNLIIRRIEASYIFGEKKPWYHSPRVKGWSKGLAGLVIEIPRGLTIRQVASFCAEDAWYREAVPRLYRALLAAERAERQAELEAAQTA